MTHEKAIEIINRKSSISNNDECFEDIETAYNMATFALKKQIATKPTRKETEFNNAGECPCCGNFVNDFEDFMCAERVVKVFCGSDNNCGN